MVYRLEAEISSLESNEQERAQLKARIQEAGELTPLIEKDLLAFVKRVDPDGEARRRDQVELFMNSCLGESERCCSDG